MTASARTAFDAVIVGAGLAGSTAAIQLARAGWSVALIERQRFPRRKVCGECIAASNLPLLQALGVGDAFHALAGAELRHVTLLHGERAVTAELPAAVHGQEHGHGQERFACGRALGRETLDGLLLDQARAAGATVESIVAIGLHISPFRYDLSADLLEATKGLRWTENECVLCRTSERLF